MLKKRTTSIVLALALIASASLSSGCDSFFSSDSKEDSVALDAESARQAYLAARKNMAGPETYDEILADLALEVPGYGGHFADENGDLNVYLVSTQQRDAALSALTQRFDAGVLSRFDNDRVAAARVRQGRYDFLQLYNWRVALRRDVLGMDGVTSLDINEAKNNITLGVEDLGLKGKVLGAVRELGIPVAAINVVEQKPATNNLRKKRTTLAGGLQIQYVAPSWPGDPWQCTLGPLAKRNGVKGFIINAHCTEFRFTNNSEKFYQAKISDRHIATETVDPNYFTGGACPSTKVCVYADAVFAKWENAGTYNFGHIYETNSSGHTTGSTTRKSTRFTITSDGVWPYPGQLVQKVGRSAGWTYGNVLATCVDIDVSPHFSYPSTNLHSLCQIKADYGFAGGDSGSPVFQIVSGNNVTLLGIHWGNDGPDAFFSFSGFIKDHLGGSVIFH